ncbi:MAG: glycosyltransferase family 4 protein [Pseudomonadales bacterium]
MLAENTASLVEPVATTVATFADIEPSHVPSHDVTQQLVVEHKPLKICLLGYRSEPYGGGQGIYIKYLSRALVGAGHQVDVISGQPYPHVDPRVKLIKMPGMDLFEMGLGSLHPRDLKSMTNIIEWTGKLTGAFAEPHCFGRRVLKYLQKKGRHYDIIHDNQSLSWGMLTLQRRDFTLVTTIHHPITRDLKIALNAANNWCERLFIRRWYSFLTMQKKVAKRLYNVVTVSERSREDIAAAFAIQPAGISLVYNGIDTEEFRPMPDVTRKPYRIMATASADTPVKGLRYLLEAIAALASRYPELTLLIVGKPMPGGDTEQLIRRLALGERIRFVSGISTPQLVAHYAQAQVVVVPSVYEGFGLPAGEAMACGVPVVSTNGGALPEVVGDAGIQVPVKDSQAIAQAVADLLGDADKRQRLGEAGRQRIEQLFCWKRAARQMTDYYRHVLDNKLKNKFNNKVENRVANANG